MVEYNNVEYEYDFKNNSWLKCTRFSSGRICITHNSPHKTTPLDPPIPEEIVLETAKKEFGDKYENFSKIKSPIVGFPDLLTASIKGSSRISVKMLYDFGTEKFIIHPSNQSSGKMTLEQKKTLIKMIHEI